MEFRIQQLLLKMEQILKLYQQRLNQLTMVFVRLLENIEKCKLFTCSHSHSQYRFEFILNMVKTTLENNQQRTIRKLQGKINELSDSTSSSSQLLGIRLQIPQIFPKYSENTNQKAPQYCTPSSPINKKSKHSLETKVNSCESSYQEKEWSVGSSEQEQILSYKFKYLKLKL